MIKIENVEVDGWKPALRGMRNPMDSWNRSDSVIDHMPIMIGPNDDDLMHRLAKSGTDHRKYMRMITVYADITAPLYWWSEYDTYKVGTVANSCSKMHTIHKREIGPELFSLDSEASVDDTLTVRQANVVSAYLGVLEELRGTCQQGDAKWRKLIQLLPEGFNQKRTVMLNYEVLANMYRSRQKHKLKEWRDLCHWIEGLPHSDIITGKEI